MAGFQNVVILSYQQYKSFQKSEGLLFHELASLLELDINLEKLWASERHQFLHSGSGQGFWPSKFPTLGKASGKGQQIELEATGLHSAMIYVLQDQPGQLQTQQEFQELSSTL